MRAVLFALAALVAVWSAYARAHPISTENGTGCPKNAVCGSVPRPLDPAGRVKGTISVAYRLYPHLDSTKPTAGTIVAQEGGPGFSTFGSAYGYLELFKPLRQDHDMVMIDARGTGRSGAIDCPSVQHSPIRKPADVGACGRFLGQAADLYGTKLAADDMAAVLDVLHIDKVDYYGDSYGTFFGQVFSALYPNRLRSVVLDSAYPVIGETPWYSHAGDVVRKGFNEACKRAPYCAALEGNSLDRIRKIISYVAKKPISGRAPDGEGRMHRVTVDPGLIGQMLFDGTEGPVNYRELDAAIRAWFDNNDPAPLVRLGSENLANEYPQPPRAFSYGLFSAVSCMDYQQIYDMNSPVSERHEQRDAAIAKRKMDAPKTYDPLTIDQFQSVPIDISVLNFCLDWPIHHPPYTPGSPIPDGAKMTDAPTLVLNGELDMLTTAAEGAIVTAQYPHGQQLVVANSFHVVAVDDVSQCAEKIVQRFVATLDLG
ncbi:MAG TPA: alpha/beta fold hydrolase, partial [Rhizomicrobium sp.]|nr:alpha/beta fold hydrolase [Rhizomicrobium sp.]